MALVGWRESGSIAPGRRAGERASALGRYVLVTFFFFSSRRRHTRLQGDWSSDVCSSDLAENSTFIDQDFPADAKPLTGDGADVAFVALAPDSKKVQDLLRAPDILLMDF